MYPSSGMENGAEQPGEQIIDRSKNKKDDAVENPAKQGSERIPYGSQRIQYHLKRGEGKNRFEQNDKNGQASAKEYQGHEPGTYWIGLRTRKCTMAIADHT